LEWRQKNNKGMMMNIAQALRKVRKLKGQMAELTTRAASVVSHNEKNAPDFDFLKIRAELDRVRDQLVLHQAAIAIANAVTMITVGEREMTLAEAIRRLHEIRAEKAWLSGLALRYGEEESFDYEYDGDGRSVRVKTVDVWISAMKEPERVEQLARLQDRFDELNDAVEAANHRTEVPEIS